MLEDKKIKFVLPDASYSKSYLNASKEFSNEQVSSKNFLVTRITPTERLTLNTGLADFHKKIVLPCMKPYGEEKKCYVFWVIMEDKYIGEICIKDKFLEKSYIKKLAQHQYKWNELYNDDVKRYTTVSAIIIPTARSSRNLEIIACLLHEKLKELGFNEFVMNCYKKDRGLNSKLYRMMMVCEGKLQETLNTVEYIIPVKPDEMRQAVNDKFMVQFINNTNSFSDLVLGLKYHLLEDNESYINKKSGDINNITTTLH